MPLDSFAFYEAQYLRERDRKDHLNSAISMPIGIVGVLVGAMTVYVPLARTQLVDPYWMLAWIVAVVSLGMTIYYLVRAYYHFRYRMISDAQKLFTLQKELRAYYDGHGGDAAADKHFEGVVIEKYAGAAAINSGNNDRKAAYLHRATTYLLVAGLTVLVGGMPFLAGMLEAREREVYKVEVSGCANSVSSGRTACLKKSP